MWSHREFSFQLGIQSACETPSGGVGRQLDAQTRSTSGPTGRQEGSVAHGEEMALNATCRITHRVQERGLTPGAPAPTGRERRGRRQGDRRLGGLPEMGDPWKPRRVSVLRPPLPWPSLTCTDADAGNWEDLRSGVSRPEALTGSDTPPLEHSSSSAEQGRGTEPP